MTNTARTDPIMGGMVFHEQSKGGGYEASLETDGVFIDLSKSLAVQVTVCSSRRSPTLWVVLQNIFLRLALTSCWSGGRSSFFDEMFSKDCSTDDSSEDG